MASQPTEKKTGKQRSPVRVAFNAADILHKTWSAESVHKYIGNFKKSWFAYAASENIRENAASGGVITALLAHLLRSGEIDGALVCRSIIADGKVRPQFFIANSEQALLEAQGSKYSAVDFNQDALPLLRDFKGKLAVVALPCDTTHLRHACEHDPQLKAKVALVITLFCGHNSRPELTDMVVRKLAPKGATLSDFRYRRGHWRGSLAAQFADGAQVEKPFLILFRLPEPVFLLPAEMPSLQRPHRLQRRYFRRGYLVAAHEGESRQAQRGHHAHPGRGGSLSKSH